MSACRSAKGGEHINRGIPHRAFHLTAMKLGGGAWQKAGPIWFDALLRLGDESSFQDAPSLPAPRTRKRADRPV